MAEYVKIDWNLFRYGPQTTPENIAYLTLVDHLSTESVYDINGFIQDTELDVFVCGVDTIGFIRHILERSASNDFTSIVLQHGIYSRHLTPAHIERRRGRLSPSLSSGGRLGERIKRRVGYRHGVTMYCNPYVDYVATMGEFFTKRIGELREEFPTNGQNSLRTTGTPEYDDEVRPYQPDTKSILFLSQQQMEDGEWDHRQQQRLNQLLSDIGERFQLSIRPHPKDSKDKIESMSSYAPISEGNSLTEDIRTNDIILTVDSTAIFEAITQGKVCGVIDLPWYISDFPAFTHEHLIQISDSSADITRAAETRSETTQFEYLDQFCYMPGEDDTTDAGSSAELLSNQIVSDME